MNAVLNDDNLKINAETERRRELIITISLRLCASAVKKNFWGTLLCFSLAVELFRNNNFSEISFSTGIHRTEVGSGGYF